MGAIPPIEGPNIRLDFILSAGSMMPELQPQDIERVMHGNEDLMQLSHYVDPHMLDRYSGGFQSQILTTSPAMGLSRLAHLPRKSPGEHGKAS